MIIVNIVLQIITLAVVFYLIYFNNYLKEKGKNLATQEDIEKITSKIEKVKFEIQHSSLQKSEWLDKNKIAILEYYETYIEFVEFTIKDISVVESNFLKPEKIRQKIDHLLIQQSKVDKAFWKLCLFELDDSGFIEVIREANISADNLSNLTFDFLIDNEKNATNMLLTLESKSKIASFIEIRKKTIDVFIKDRDIQEKIVNQKTQILMHLIRRKIKEKYEQL